jgi:hypothetical protein
MLALALAALGLLPAAPSAAGPPFETDDPEPVACHHVEVDVAEGRQGEPAMTGPIWEVDYGPTRNVEVSVGGAPGETEIASAIRFIPESKYLPQVGFLPAVTFKSDGSAEAFLPFWVQKSIKDWTIFGGGGVAAGNEFTGIALTRNFRSGSNLGVELYRESQREPGAAASPRIGMGWTDQISPSHALMVWAGRSFQPAPQYFFYVGVQGIFGPKGHAANCKDS